MPNFFDKTLPNLTSSVRVKLLLLFLLGQVLGLEHGEGIRFDNLILGWLVIILGYISLSFLDNYLHHRTNKIVSDLNPNLKISVFSNQKLLILGASSIFISFLAAAIHTYLNEYLLVFPLFALGISLSLLYTVPPFKLKFRGGAEIYKTLSLVLFVPLFSSYLQAGTWVWDKSLAIIIPTSFLVLGTNISSSLIREKSDKYIGRQSLISIIGNPSAKLFTEYSFLAAMFLIGLFQFFIANPLVSYFAFGSMGVLLLTFFQLRKTNASATLKNPTNLLQYQRYSDYGVLLSLIPIICGVVFNYWVGP